MEMQFSMDRTLMAKYALVIYGYEKNRIRGGQEHRALHRETPDRRTRQVSRRSAPDQRCFTEDLFPRHPVSQDPGIPFRQGSCLLSGCDPLVGSGRSTACLLHEGNRPEIRYLSSARDAVPRCRPDALYVGPLGHRAARTFYADLSQPLVQRL